MDFIKNNWILLLILVVLAYLVYRYWQKTKLVQEVKASNSNNSSIVGDFKNVIKSDTGTVVATTTVAAPVKTINNDINSWKIGDKVYAGENGANTYTAPNAGVNNLSKHYNKDSYIGTFLANENGYAKLVTQSIGDSIQIAFGHPVQASVVYSLSKSVYSK